MKLKVFDIPESGMDLQAFLPPSVKPKRFEDEWFSKIAREAFAELLPEDAKASLELHLLRTVDNIQIAGRIEAGLRPTCDRCAEVFRTTANIPLHVYLAPHKTMNFTKGEEEEGLGEDDVAFSFYKGDEIDLTDIVREMILLEMPVRNLCSEDCKGLCPQCGQNLNVKTCDCGQKKIDPRLAFLKTIKLKTS